MQWEYINRQTEQVLARIWAQISIPLVALFFIIGVFLYYLLHLLCLLRFLSDLLLLSDLLHSHNFLFFLIVITVLLYWGLGCDLLGGRLLSRSRTVLLFLWLDVVILFTDVVCQPVLRSLRGWLAVFVELSFLYTADLRPMARYVRRTLMRCFFWAARGP